jgi:predicted dehydrogenase
MGRGHLRHFLQYPEVQVLAVCDVDAWRRENAQATVQRTYSAGRRGGAHRTYRGCAAYVDLRELVARGDIDAAVIVTGDRWHAAATVMAAQAGKDVYVEKPLCLTIAEGRAMVEAVRRYGRVCQVGLQQRSGREFRIACQLVRDGALGKIDRVYTIFSQPSIDIDLPAEPTPPTLHWDLWLGPSPWRPFNHRFHYLGRPACDVSIGCQSTIVPLLGCIARWTGRALKWDPAREEFLGDDDANRMRCRTMREPWRV